MAERTTYEILDGVRRAKAAQLCGRHVVDARVNGVGDVVSVSIDDLFSPKESIVTSGIRGLSWGKILRSTLSDMPLPPIEIVEGARGVPISEVVVEEDDWDAFRRT